MLTPASSRRRNISSILARLESVALAPSHSAQIPRISRGRSGGRGRRRGEAEAQAAKAQKRSAWRAAARRRLPAEGRAAGTSPAVG